MEWHWYYIFGIAFVVIHAWAFLSKHREPDPEIEKMWEDNF